MRSLIKFINRLNDHWVGDLIGVISIFATGYILLLMGHGLGY